MTRIVIVGSHGQLGAELLHRLTGHPALEGVALERAALDVTDAAACHEVVRSLAPAVVVNATAYNQVDRAEAEPELAFAVNALGPRSLAAAATAAGAWLVHVSTDYVFGGAARTPRRETDLPCPTSVYAATKLAGEHLVAAQSPEHLILRTSGLYGARGRGASGGNFVATMLRLAREGRPLRVVDDQHLGPTSVADLAETIVGALERHLDGDRSLAGVVHATNAGACTWRELAVEALRLAGIEHAVEPATTAEWGAPAARPAYSVLANDRLEAAGLTLRPWPEALADHLADLNRRSGT